MSLKLYLNSEVILNDVKMADTFIKRLRGFMFYKIPPSKAIVIKPCNSIHTFFMRFNIDVLFLDHDMVVLQKIEDLKKNKMVMPIKNAYYVVETEAMGFKDVEVGDIVSIC